MSPTKARVIQYIVIITILTLASGAGYAWYSTRAAINQKAATNRGLVGYWSFDEGTGTQAGDASGSGNTGTLTNGPTWVDGKLKKGISFDGTNDYVSMGNVLDFTTGDFSLSAWIKPPNQNTVGSIIAKRDGSAPFKQYSLAQGTVVAGGTTNASKKISFFAYNGNGVGGANNTQSYYTTNDVIDGKWHYVVGLRSSGTVKIYVDGVDMALTTVYSAATNPDVSNTANFNIGYANGTAYLNSLIDEARVYNRALTATEVTNLYNLGVAKVNATENSNLTNSLVGLWSFNGADVSGTTAYDRSGSSNNGTLVNGPTVIPGKLGQAMSFNGSNQNIDTTFQFSTTDGTQAYSINAWIKTTDTDGVVVQQYTGGEANRFLFAVTTQGKMTWAKTAVGLATSTAQVNDNQWHMVSGTRNSSGLLQLYVDGIASGSSGTDTFPFNAGQLVRIAGPGIGSHLEGSLDDVRIYNRTLSAGEIRDLYQLGTSDKVNSADVQMDSLERDIIGYWKLDENTGTTASDATGNVTGTLTNGPTWTTGRIGSGVTFDGTDDYITMGASSRLNVTGPLTIGAWIYPTSFGANSKGRVVDKLGNTTAGYVLFVDNVNVANGISFGVNDTVGAASFFVANSITLNTWQHVAITLDPNRLATMYVNGVSVASSTMNAFPSSNANNFVIGGRTTDNTRNFAGSIDEVRTYGRALSADEIAHLYQTTTPDNPDTSLKGYWSFDGPDISGTTAYDRSGNGNNGTLTNGPTVIPGKLGQALSFDGTDDLVSIAGTQNIQNVSYWIKPNTSIYSKYAVALSGSKRYFLNNGLYSGTNTTTRYINAATPSAESLGSELFSNGNVETGNTSGWDVGLQGGATGSISAISSNPYAGTYALDFNVTNGGSSSWHAQVQHATNISITSGILYKVQFAAKGSVAQNGVRVSLQQQGSPYTSVCPSYDYDLTTSWVLHTFYCYGQFSDSTIRSYFWVGNLGALHLYLDNISMKPVNSIGDVTTDAWNFVSVNLDSPVTADNTRLGSGSGFFNGTLDDVRMYNRALTATEITSLYNQGR